MEHPIAQSKGWIIDSDYPEWGNNEFYLQTIQGGYLIDDETPKQAYVRVAKAAADRLNKPELTEKFFQIIWNNWLCLSTPVLSNMGTKRGLPISCITGETWVNTKDDGGKQAKDIQVGDYVLTHKGRYKPVTKVMITENRSNIYKLKVNTRMTNLYITENHKVLTNLGWVRVDELEVDKHLIAVNKKLLEKYTESNYIIDLKKYVPYKYVINDGKIQKAIETKNKRVLKRNHSVTHVTNYASPYEKIEVTESLAWALGLWFAEGSLSKNAKGLPNGIRITLNAKDEVHLGNKWLGIVTKTFNLNGNNYVSKVKRNKKDNTWLNVNVSSTILGSFFKTFGEGCKHKLIPEWILNGNELNRKAFLQGMLDGDGSVRNNTNKLTLSNAKLLLQVYKLGLSLDKSMSLQMQEKHRELSTTPHVYTVIFRNYLNSKSRNNASAGIEFNDGLVYCPIRTLELTNKTETVYDFTVDEDHSFSCAGVVVHNCFNSYVEDSLYEINRKIMEIAILSKNGGGTSANFSDIRPAGSPISTGGTTDGIIPFLKQLDSTVKASKQLPVRRGACAVYLDIDHKDYLDFLKIRKGQGDPDRQQMRLHQGAIISDSFMKKMVDGDEKNRERWIETMRWRIERGEPYMFFKDNANKVWWNKLGLPEVNASNLCSEIMLPTDKDHSFVCCLSSLNLYRWDEFKDTDTIQLSIWFLDAVLQEFIEKAKNIKGIEDAVRFAEKSRAVGLGVLGWHTYLQSKMIPLESIEARSNNKIIFKKIHEEALIATKELAKEYGEPEWLKGTGRRNLTLEAIAPTRSNSKLSGGVSQGIEPIDANIYTDNDSKGSYVRKNLILKKLLVELNKDTAETWNSINAAKGSVQHLDFLTDEQKQIFKTFREINQMELVKQAADRQPYIEQGQSLNLAFAYDAPAKWVNQVHIKAWELGLKGLYYYRSQSVLNASNDLYQECVNCEG